MRNLRDGFIQWADETDLSGLKIRSNHSLSRAYATESPVGRGKVCPFIVSNTFVVWKDNGLIFDPFFETPDSACFYLLPSEKWVGTVDEVIAEWDQWHGFDY
ncbi:hypothetical protein LOC71_21340 [Rhodopirellula sp. JC740]|uniref:Uncharacterized protein n=1 Tax=Rhodopirellula halodulae TaxID=2894198 RepID=A0ABS8NMM0_9BACT|nr:hypothetical protein [Rhodopirellula sp. JC740]MCC9644828.1 hypothetical protein [Rhodopirellula sp. JC740]